MVKDEVITLPNGEPFAVTRIVKQPDGQGRGGVVDVHANRTR